MALWRDLIPRLHRADDFDSRLHLLDDYDNKTTFDESGTRLLPPSDWDPKPPTSTPSTTEPPVLATSAGTSTDGGRTSSTAGTVASKSSPPTSTSTVADSGELAVQSQDKDDEDHSTLFKTAAVGCALLALNVVVFTAVMCQWRGLRRTRLIELQKYASGFSSGGGGAGGGGIVLGVPCPSAAAADDVGDRVVAAYPESPAGRGDSLPPSPSAAATVLTPADCTCNNIGVDGGSGLSGIVLTAPNNYYTYSSAANHVGDYINQRTTSTV